MTGYLVRRLFQMFITLFFVSVATYYLFSIAPGGPTAGLRQTQQKLTPKDRARIEAKYELDLYLPVRFSRWLMGVPNGPIVIGNLEILANVPMGCFLKTDTGCEIYVYPKDIPKYHPVVKSSKGILRGDFGQSTVVRIGQPAINEIISRLPATLELGILSLFFSLLLGVPIGIYSAVRQYSRFDYFATTISFIGSAMPTFFFGLLMILIFAITPVFLQGEFPWIPRLPPGLRTAVRPYDIASWWTNIQPNSFADRFLHMLMPLTVLTFFNIAGWSRFVRASMLEVLRQDYVRTARAKGLMERIVIVKHALRNALIPFVTIFVLALPGIFGGAIITETIFAWPGMGRLYIDALGRSDYPIALATVFITGVLTVVATLLGDILYTIVDPRIKFS